MDLQDKKKYTLAQLMPIQYMERLTGQTVVNIRNTYLKRLNTVKIEKQTYIVCDDKLKTVLDTFSFQKDNVNYYDMAAKEFEFTFIEKKQ